jgi:hypothetical protein
MMNEELFFGVREWHMFYPTVVPAALPIGLKHLDSDFCWCDPIIEVNDNGQEVMLHQQVMWN